MVGAGTQDHGMGQSPLVTQPVVRLPRKVCDTPQAEKFRRAALRRRFLRDRLDAIFTIFVERPILIRIGPGATRTIDSVELIELRKCGDPSEQPGFFESELDCFEHGRQPGGNASRWGYADAMGLNRRLGLGQLAALGTVRPLDRDAAVDSRFGFCHNSPPNHEASLRQTFRTNIVTPSAPRRAKN